MNDLLEAIRGEVREQAKLEIIEKEVAALRAALESAEPEPARVRGLFVSLAEKLQLAGVGIDGASAVGNALNRLAELLGISLGL